jgi:hypothetical protein
MLKSWEDMTVLEQYQSQYWDMYKDAYGFRPRGIDTSTWTESDFEKAFDSLAEAISAGEKARAEDEARAIVRFGKLVEKTMQAGACDRETALRWIMEGSDCNGDWEYLAYRHSLPYDFFKKEV